VSGDTVSTGEVIISLACIGLCAFFYDMGPAGFEPATNRL
jgi:hypothetical protein